ncbi:hypothetical protein ACEPAG_3653 [Sanghuangporus baumii]
MLSRWFHQSDSDAIASEEVDTVRRIADCDGVRLSEMKEVVDVLKQMIDSCPLKRADRQVLCHPDFALWNIIVHPKTHKIRVIIDWDSTAVLPFKLFPQYFQDLCSADVKGVEIHSRDIYAALPTDDESKAHDFSSPLHHIPPGEFAKSDMKAIKAFMEVAGMSWVEAEHLQLQWEYPLFIQSWNERLPPEAWGGCAKAKIVHYLIMRGFTMWCHFHFMLVEDAPPVSHTSSGRSGEPSCEETTSNTLDTLSGQKLRAETDGAVDSDKPWLVRSLFFASLLPLLYFSIRRVLSRA